MNSPLLTALPIPWPAWALARNRLVAALAAELLVPGVAGPAGAL